MISDERRAEARETQERLRAAWAELRNMPGGIGHLVDLQLDASALIGDLVGLLEPDEPIAERRTVPLSEQREGFGGVA